MSLLWEVGGAASQDTGADIQKCRRRSTALTLSCILVWEHEGAVTLRAHPRGPATRVRGGRGRSGSRADTPEAASCFLKGGFAFVGGRRRQGLVGGAGVTETAS